MLASFAILMALTTAAPDEVALIWDQPSKPKAQELLHLHELQDPPTSDPLGALQAADSTFLKWTTKKNPVRFAFPGDWDGDRIDELIVVRERLDKKDHRLTLTVHRAPTKLGGQSSKPIASSKKADLGVAVGDFRVVGIGGVDVDGDDIDDVVTVVERLNGARYLIVRRLPSGKSKSMGFPIRSDFTFGDAIDGDIVSITGLDVDQDNKEEIAIVIRSSFGTERMELYSAPPAPASETGPPLWVAADVGAADGAAVETISAATTASSTLLPVERVALLRRGLDGVARLDVHAVPSVGTGLGAPLTSAPLPGFEGFDVDLRTAFMLREPFYFPWEKFSGSWSVRYHIAYKLADGTITDNWIGPFQGFQGGANAGLGFVMNFPNSSVVLNGLLGGWTTGSQVLVGANPVQWVLNKPSGIAKSGDIIAISHPSASLTLTGDQYSFKSTFDGFTYIGELRGPAGQLYASILEYEFIHN